MVRALPPIDTMTLTILLTAVAVGTQLPSLHDVSSVPHGPAVPLRSVPEQARGKRVLVVHAGATHAVSFAAPGVFDTRSLLWDVLRTMWTKPFPNIV